MASINYAAREINVKIVYYGPGLSGKTTNLQVIHRKVPPEFKSDMVSLATETDRTLFFDFLPLDLGKIKGFATKFQLYTVPGQVYYNATRKLVLRGVDGVVFVADSAQDKIDENIESFQNLEDNLAEYGYKRENIPIIMQYNKRDLPNALPVEELHQYVNKYNLPWSEAVANKGVGVFDSLKLIGKIVIDFLNKKYSRSPRSAGGSAPQRPTPPKPAAPPPRNPPMQQQSQQPPKSMYNQLGQSSQRMMYPQQMRQPPQPPPQMPQNRGPQQQQQAYMPQQQQRGTPQQQYQQTPQQRPPVPPRSEESYDEHITFEPAVGSAPRANPPQNQPYEYGSINLESMNQQQQPPAASQQQFEPVFDSPQNQPMQQPSTFDSSGKTDLDLEIEKYQREIEEKQRRGGRSAPSQMPPYTPSQGGQPGQPPFPQSGPQQNTQQDYDVYNMDVPSFEAQQPRQQQQQQQPQPPAQPMIGNADEDEMYFTSVDRDRQKKPIRRPVNPRTQQQKGFLSKFFNKDMP